jgi:hypothetical protein
MENENMSENFDENFLISDKELNLNKIEDNLNLNLELLRENFQEYTTSIGLPIGEKLITNDLLEFTYSLLNQT